MTNAISKSTNFIIGIICLLFCGNAFAQVNITRAAKRDLDMPREKVYVHTDQSFYLTGEILWFKAYVTDAASRKPMNLSKVLYVEIIDSAHQPVMQGKIAINKGMGSGSFMLPFSISSGNYELRAYTNWMKNYSPANYFRKIVSIVNTAKGIIPDSSNNSSRYPVQFSQGGEQPVNGLTSEAAFKSGQQLIVNINTDQKSYETRHKVEVDISTNDKAGQAQSANLSVAVYKIDALHQPDQKDIFTYLRSSSGIKGAVRATAYHLNNDNAESTFVPENIGHIITGKVTDTRTGQPVSGAVIYLSVPGKLIQFHGCISDNLGRVHFDMKDFYGAHEIVAQTANVADSFYHIAIFSPFSEKYANEPLPPLKITRQYRDMLEAGNLQMEVQNAYHANKLSQLIPPPVDSTPFWGKPYKSYLLDAYTRFTTMEEVMREYVDEVNVRKQQGHYHFITFNAPAFEMHFNAPEQTFFDNNPLVLLDGVPVLDIDKIIAYDPLKVRKLEVVAERYYYGAVSADGILSYTTYKGNMEGFPFDPHDLVLDYNGLQEQRTFYAPDYSITSDSHLPDFRHLLYWSPDIKTNISGKDKFSFFTSDIPGKYLIVVQGITDNGLAGSGTFEFNVEK